MKDTRIVYGARCTWWDSIDKIGKLGMGTMGALPCCPHCRSPLLEMADSDTWFLTVDQYEAMGHPGYRAKVEWSRGKCFQGIGALNAAYEAREIKS